MFKKRYLVEKAFVPDDANELDMNDGEAGSSEIANAEEEKGRTASKSRGATPGNARFERADEYYRNVVKGFELSQKVYLAL